MSRPDVLSTADSFVTSLSSLSMYSPINHLTFCPSHPLCMLALLNRVGRG
jgi:hypothetical protein